MIDRIRQARRVRVAYREFFRSVHGQTVLKDMMRTTMMFTDTGVLPDEQLRQVEGARNLVRRTILLASITDDQLDQMIQQPVVTGDSET
jgi:hypothetical protein